MIPQAMVIHHLYTAKRLFRCGRKKANSLARMEYSSPRQKRLSSTRQFQYPYCAADDDGEHDGADDKVG